MASPSVGAVGATVLSSVALGPVSEGRLALLAPRTPNLLAASSCGRLVHILRAGERLRCWRLPLQALLLEWDEPPLGSEDPVLVAITIDGRAWRLSLDDGSADRTGPKRPKTAGTLETLDEDVKWRPPLAVGLSQRIDTPPILTFDILEITFPAVVNRALRLPAHLLPPASSDTQGRDLVTFGNGRPNCVLCIHNCATAAVDANSRGAPLTADLYHALVGGHGNWILHVDETLSMCATHLGGHPEQPFQQAGPTPSLLQLVRLGKSPYQILACPTDCSHTKSGSFVPDGSDASLASDTLVVLLGMELLLLSADRNGILRQQLWALPTLAHTARWIGGRALILLTAPGALLVRIPAVADISAAAEVAALTLVAPSDFTPLTFTYGAGGAAGCSATVSQNTPAPDLPAQPIALSALGVALASTGSTLPSTHGREAYERPEVTILGSDGYLAHLRLEANQALSLGEAGSGGRQIGPSTITPAVAGVYCAPFVERQLRRTLHQIGTHGAALKATSSEVERVSQSLKAIGRAIGAVSVLESDVHLSSALRPVLFIKNKGGVLLGEGWSATALLLQKESLPLPSTSGTQVSSHSFSISAFPAKGSWRIELPFQLEETTRPAVLHVFACYSASPSNVGVVEAPFFATGKVLPSHEPSTCLLLGSHVLNTLNLLRPAKALANIGASGTLTVERNVRRVLHGVSALGRSMQHESLPSRVHETQFKLRLFARRESIPALLRAFLRKSACDVSGDGKDEPAGVTLGSGSGSLVAELPSGAQISIRLHVEGGSDVRGGDTPLVHLTVQSQSAAALWSIRASILRLLIESAEAAFESQGLTENLDQGGVGGAAMPAMEEVSSQVAFVDFMMGKESSLAVLMRGIEWYGRVISGSV